MEIKEAINADKWLVVYMDIDEARELHDICKTYTRATTWYDKNTVNNEDLKEGEFWLNTSAVVDSLHVSKSAKSRYYTLTLMGDSITFGNWHKDQIIPLAAIAYCIISGYFYVHEEYFEEMMTNALNEKFSENDALLESIEGANIVGTHNNMRKHGVCSVCALLEWQIDRNN